MANPGTLEGERVFCHQCGNEWDRRHGGLECPRCHSEFTEILSSPVSPSPAPQPPQHPLHHHNPWVEETYPDPPEEDINTVRINTRLGNGTVTFTSRTYTSGGARSPFGMRGNDPASAQVGRDFTSLLESLMGVHGSNRPGGYPQQPPMGATGFFGPPPGGSRRNGGTLNEPDFPQTPFGPFGAIFGAMGSFPSPNQRHGAPGPGPDMLPLPLLLIQQLMNPRGAHGDAVFSQEALDRVISQLMEQNIGSNAAPPASEDAIQSLPKRPLEKSMLDSDGKADCSICMDSVEVGDLVTFLPCKHWFHEGCVTAWLKEHDTCPHCRASISNPSHQPGRDDPSSPDGRAGDPRRPHGRHHFPGGSSQIPGGSRRASEHTPGSSERERGSESYYDRPPRPNLTRHDESHRSGSGSGAGGLTGWLRRPFGSRN